MITLDVPFSKKRIDLLRLSDEQQMQIARAMRGEEGARLVDEAWRTAGVRELVTNAFRLDRRWHLLA